MVMRKIIHAADIHLDSPLQKLDQYENAPVERIRGASRRALENLVELALEQEVDLVVIAGDLYDGDWTDQNTGLFFVAQASRLINAGIPLVVIRGNHDAMNLMTSSLPLPKNPDGSEIMMSSDRVDLRTIESAGIAVHGRSFRTRAESDNLAMNYPRPLGGMFNLGLLHTCLEGSEQHARYAPCTAKQLTDKEYDYWALGHIHQRGEHQVDQDSTPIVFSGNIQGRHIREQGPKGCVLIEVDSAGKCQRHFHSLDVVRWQACTIDASHIHDLDEIHDEFQAWLTTQVQAAENRLLVTRVEVTGKTSAHPILHRNIKQLTASLRAASLAFGDQAWLERVKLSTALPDEATSVAMQDEGPMESLRTVIKDLAGASDLSAVFQQEFRSLLKKLPDDWSSAGGDSLDNFENTAWMQQLIESSSAEVYSRLNETNGGSA